RKSEYWVNAPEQAGRVNTPSDNGGRFSFVHYCRATERLLRGFPSPPFLGVCCPVCVLSRQRAPRINPIRRRPALSALLVVVLSGLDAVKRIRQRPRFRLLPVILLSGHSAPGPDKQALDAGANAYEVTPQSFPELVALVKRIAAFWLYSGGL